MTPTDADRPVGDYVPERPPTLWTPVRWLVGIGCGLLLLAGGWAAVYGEAAVRDAQQNPNPGPFGFLAGAVPVVLLMGGLGAVLLAAVGLGLLWLTRWRE